MSRPILSLGWPSRSVVSALIKRLLVNERAGAQAHFIDLCRVLEVPEPDDPERYCFGLGVA